FQAEDGIRDDLVTGVQTCALPIYLLQEILESIRLEPRQILITQRWVEHFHFRFLLTLEVNSTSRELQQVAEDYIRAIIIQGLNRSEERRVGKEYREYRWSDCVMIS